jgi:3-phenylpropionate/trans-cinnamate dioxygenase ferredoxin reductase subunit
MSFANESEDAIYLHIRRIAGGRVSSALGVSINKGHPVRLQGPYGGAYLRPRQSNRLILISSGTGFAPIWSIAKAALGENPDRPIIMLLGAQRIEALYMGAAVQVLRQHRTVRIVPVVTQPAGATAKGFRKGRPTDYVPPLNPDDIVYACGAAPMVEAARSKAVAAGAMFYADTFVPQTDEVDEGLLSRVFERLSELRFGADLLEAPRTLLRLERPR